MAGVEILAMKEVVISSAFNWTAFWIALAAFLSGGFLIGVLVGVGTYDYSNVVVGVILGLLAGILFGSMLGDTMGTPTEYAAQYKVTISDEVSMNEFLERYEIIGQEGKIYTVRERSGDAE